MRKTATPMLPPYPAAVDAHLLEKWLVKMIQKKVSQEASGVGKSLQHVGSIGGQLTAYHNVLDLIRTHVMIDLETET